MARPLDFFEELNLYIGENDCVEDTQPDGPSHHVIEQLCQLTDETSSRDPQSITTCQTNEKTQNVIKQPETGVKLKDLPDINEILTTDEALITPTSHNVTIINAACQQVLKEMEQQLLFMLKKNRKEQEMVLNYLNTNGRISSAQAIKKMNLKCLGIPYFKDISGYPPPLNEDVLRKKRNEKLLPVNFIESFPTWTSSDAKSLFTAVTTALHSKSPDYSDDVNLIDWMKISATDMDGKYSPFECRSKWVMNLSPSINRSRWRSKEIKSLEAIVKKYNHQDWDNIAFELGTNRTSFQCCVKFQTHRTATEGKWTKKEDKLLKEIVEKYRVKDYIPWFKVTWHFEQRSLRQCQERYIYHLSDIKKGSFSMEEDFLITFLATKLKNFGEVAKFFPKRVSTQLRSRYEYLVKLSMPEFTREEDELLTNLMTLYPRNWEKISESFKNRTKLQCRGRWTAIQKEIKLDNDLVSESETDECEELSENKDIIEEKNERKMDFMNVKKNLVVVSKPGEEGTNKRRYPVEYFQLLKYHKHCYKFLFGPKPRVPQSSLDCDKLFKKMRMAMATLSVGSIISLKSFDITSLLINCEFDNEDTTVLSIIKNAETQEKSKNIVLSSKIIPPNFTTLVGLRTLLLAWSEIGNFCDSYKPTKLQCKRSEISSDNRILFSDARRLFKTRIKSLFTLPLLLSNIPQDGIETKVIYKPKYKKTKKPMSKKRRKEHARLMSKAYREKLEKVLEKGKDAKTSKINESYYDKSSEKRQRALRKSKELKMERPENIPGESRINDLRKRRLSANTEKDFCTDMKRAKPIGLF